MEKPVYLLLENGDYFEGKSFGAPLREVTGEVVFTTGMTGYLETITDPSYFGQIVVQTFPLIGNYGVIPQDFENEEVYLSAYIVKEWCQEPSNFRCSGDLDTFFKERNIPGVYGIDTRKLAKTIRESGSMNGWLTEVKPPYDAKKLEEVKNFHITKAVETVTPKKCEIKPAEDILVIEGIHCLNDDLSYSLPRDKKFKIYISALTQLNIDDHNRVPTTDGRLIRRMVRDARTRGASAQDTIRMWDSVRRGEERNIFPYQEQADAMFNSAFLYEFSVLKQYAEPILYSVPRDSAEYSEAKRLLKFLDYFLGVSSEQVPHNSIVREFIGGSCFKV